MKVSVAAAEEPVRAAASCARADQFVFWSDGTARRIGQSAVITHP
jgi:hypothetical protein